MARIAVRKETKNKWERRTPLNPFGVSKLTGENISVRVQESPVRVYEDADYVKTGAEMVPTTNTSEIVIGIKEPPLDTIVEGQTHLCFAHVIKGQPYNMPLLKTLIEKKATLIDYEPMVDDEGVRVAWVFSYFAGISGTIETLRVYAKKLHLTNTESAFSILKQPWEYQRLGKAKEALRSIAPLKEPVRILIVGNGNVGKGCRLVCEELGIKEIAPAALEGNPPQGPWFCIVDAAEITRAKDGSAFDFKDYVKHGNERYQSTFERYLGKFDILLQGAYWDDRFPRQLPLELISMRKGDLPTVIGDISCDIEGTLECTTQATSIDDPAFTFNVTTMKPEEGITLNGPTIMSIDNLPCELPADASDMFSDLMATRLPLVANADLSKPIEQSGLSLELQRGTIVYNGKLTPAFEYLKQYLS